MLPVKESLLDLVVEDVLFRAEHPEDFTAAERVNEDAFQRPDEALLVRNLRKNNRLIISQVAQLDHEVVGHIAFSPVHLGPGQAAPKALGLAPVAVSQLWQGGGIGSRLIEQGLELARKAGYHWVVVLGMPNYYQRFGFRTASEFGLACSFDVPDEAFMAMPLKPGALDQVSGTVYYAPEFY